VEGGKARGLTERSTEGGKNNYRREGKKERKER